MRLTPHKKDLRFSNTDGKRRPAQGVQKWYEYGHHHLTYRGKPYQLISMGSQSYDMGSENQELVKSKIETSSLELVWTVVASKADLVIDR